MGLSVCKTSFGNTIISSIASGICGVSFGTDAPISGAEPVDPILLERTIAVIDGELNYHDIPIATVFHTVFENEVLKAVQEIRFGETATYQEIAYRIGRPKSHRAVANACGKNQIAILIPCHRVIKSDGKTGGYRWGIKIKKQLLLREQSIYQNTHNVSLGVSHE